MLERLVRHDEDGKPSWQEDRKIIEDYFERHRRRGKRADFYDSCAHAESLTSFAMRSLHHASARSLIARTLLLQCQSSCRVGTATCKPSVMPSKPSSGSDRRQKSWLPRGQQLLAEVRGSDCANEACTAVANACHRSIHSSRPRMHSTHACIPPMHESVRIRGNARRCATSSASNFAAASLCTIIA